MAFERIEPGTVGWEAYYANHIHRYMFAADILKRSGKRKVQDAACGVGYGAHWLAAHATAEVVAVDRDQRALEIATAKFFHPAVRYVQDDCQEMTEADKHSPFEAVVSFETIEHLPRPADFLVRCRQLLSRGGVLIISTPNRQLRNPNGAPEWEYHEQEFTAPEFLELLDKAGFRQVALHGQGLSLIGKLRQEVRAELNAIGSNPFQRLGRWLQRGLRGHALSHAVLPEQLVDFETVSFTSADECDALGDTGPFTLIGVAE
jgi:SAM-dependent methyltransferase